MAKNKFEKAHDLADKLFDLSDAIETAAGKVVDFVYDVANGMHAEIDKQARAEAMRRHPAGKGKTDFSFDQKGPFTTNGEGETSKTTPTRAEKMEFILAWLGDTAKGTPWETNPDGIKDPILDMSYQIALRSTKAFGPKAGGTGVKRQYSPYDYSS